MKNEIARLQQESNYMKEVHSEEVEKLKQIKEDIKKANKAISTINREKEPINTSIVQMKKHIDQVEQKILRQSQVTKEFLSDVVNFQSKVSKVQSVKTSKSNSTATLKTKKR